MENAANASLITKKAARRPLAFSQKKRKGHTTEALKCSIRTTKKDADNLSIYTNDIHRCCNIEGSTLWAV